MQPNQPNPYLPHRDANSSSFAYLDQLPPGTNPQNTPDPALQRPAAPPQLHNPPLPPLINPQLAPFRHPDPRPAPRSPARDATADPEAGRGQKRARPDEMDIESLEHSEPVTKQRRTDSPEPAMPLPESAPVATYQSLSPEDMHTGMVNAVKNGDLEKLQALITVGGNVHQVDEKGNSLAHAAAKNGQIEILKLLAAQHVNLNHRNHASRTALHDAAKHGQIDVVRYLLDQGCDNDDTDSKGYTPLLLAAESDHAEIVKLLEGKGCSISQKYPTGDDLSEEAFTSGNIGMIKWALSKKFYPLYDPASFAHSMPEFFSEDAYAINWLTIHGNLLGQRDKILDRFFWRAAVRGKVENLYLVVQSGWLNTLSKDTLEDLIDHTFLRVIGSGQDDAFIFLFNQGLFHVLDDETKRNHIISFVIDGNIDLFNFLKEKTFDIKSIIYHQKCLDLISCLITALSEFISNETGEDNTFRHIKFVRNRYFSYLELIKRLIELGFDVNTADENRNTPLHLCAPAGFIEIMSYLIAQGGNLNATDSKCNTPLMLSLQAYCYPDEDYSHPPEKEKLALLRQMVLQSDPAIANQAGDTALIIAAKYNLVELAPALAQVLLTHPDRERLIDSVSTTPLFQTMILNPSLVEGKNPAMSRIDETQGVILYNSISKIFFGKDKRKIQNHLSQYLYSPTGIPASKQTAAAEAGIMINTAAWNIQDKGAIENYFSDVGQHFSPELLKRTIAFISQDIEQLAEQAYLWEERNLAPVIENLPETCLSLSLSGASTQDIIDRLTSQGLYYPLAIRIAKAWQSAWAKHAAEISPIINSVSKPTFDEWENEDLSNLNPLTGEITPDALINQIKDFSASEALRASFHAELHRELNSFDSAILKIDDPNVPQDSKDLYADLMMRQLSLISQLINPEKTT